MCYHYSIDFENNNLTHHGEFNTNFSDVSEIVKAAKVALNVKLKNWNMLNKTVVKFEIYNNERKQIFLYEKQ